jgi:hypothetical protein
MSVEPRFARILGTLSFVRSPRPTVCFARPLQQTRCVFSALELPLIARSPSASKSTPKLAAGSVRRTTYGDFNLLVAEDAFDEAAHDCLGFDGVEATGIALASPQVIRITPRGPELRR